MAENRVSSRSAEIRDETEELPRAQRRDSFPYIDIYKLERFLCGDVALDVDSLNEEEDEEIFFKPSS